MPARDLASNTEGFGDQYPPSRPTFLMFLIAATVIAAIAVLMNWPTVAALIHYPQIKSTLGL
jgi:hypothetical protein